MNIGAKSSGRGAGGVQGCQMSDLWAALNLLTPHPRTDKMGNVQQLPKGEGGMGEAWVQLELTDVH